MGPEISYALYLAGRTGTVSFTPTNADSYPHGIPLPCRGASHSHRSEEDGVSLSAGEFMCLVETVVDDRRGTVFRIPRRSQIPEDPRDRGEVGDEAGRRLDRGQVITILNRTAEDEPFALLLDYDLTGETSCHIGLNCGTAFYEDGFPNHP